MLADCVDCIILGTGLTNSIFAAACSRIGKTVLHVDKNGYYGSEWASFTFQQLIDWIKDNRPNDASLSNIPDELLTHSRMFCIDLCPRLLYSDGPMVQLLVESNVSRYHEFKNNIRILSMVNNEIHVIPCRRSEVFNSSLLSDLIDKRRLMKFVELCVNYDPESGCSETREINEQADKPVSTFLEEKGLNSTLRDYIINSIAMVEPTSPVKLACSKIKKFMIATEKYGRSPFLFPIYGCGEFPQSFCRLSAVFGGTYCLNSHVEKVMIGPHEIHHEPKDHESCDPNGPQSKHDDFRVKFSNHDTIVRSKFLVMDSSTALELNMAESSKIESRLARAILITSKSLVPSSENFISFLRIPPTEQCNLVHMIELNESVMVCPPNHHIVYLWTISTSDDPEKDLNPCINRIFKDDTSLILWKYFYHQSTGYQTELFLKNEVSGLQILDPMYNDIDYKNSIEEAEKLFHRLYPDEVFLPRAPDPGEIKFDQ